MSAAREHLLSSQEYLAIERKAEIKSELINGRMYGMARTTREHNLIAVNVARQLGNRLEDRPCEAYVSGIRVKVDETGLYTYPDVTVVRGRPEFEDTHVDTLLNPLVVVEVLSSSTEACDRGAKFAHYQRLPSVEEYLLIAQDRVQVDHFLRQGEQWLLTPYRSMDDLVVFSSLVCSVPVSQMYARVEFPPVEKAPEAP